MNARTASPKIVTRFSIAIVSGAIAAAVGIGGVAAGGTTWDTHTLAASGTTWDSAPADDGTTWDSAPLNNGDGEDDGTTWDSAPLNNGTTWD